MHSTGLISSHFAIANSISALRRLLLGLVLALAISGCSKSQDSFEVMTLQGKIEEIDTTSETTGEITVLYYSEKHKQDMMGTGLITAETEIMINGAISKLADLREGDRVRGEVRVEKKRGEKIQTALKIYVDRAKPSGPSDDVIPPP